MRIAVKALKGLRSIVLYADQAPVNEQLVEINEKHGQ